MNINGLPGDGTAPNINLSITKPDRASPTRLDRDFGVKNSHEISVCLNMIDFGNNRVAVTITYKRLESNTCLLLKKRLNGKWTVFTLSSTSPVFQTLQALHISIRMHPCTYK